MLLKLSQRQKRLQQFLFPVTSFIDHKKPLTTQGDRKSVINRDDTSVQQPGNKNLLIFIIKATKRLPMIQSYYTEIHIQF